MTQDTCAKQGEFTFSKILNGGFFSREKPLEFIGSGQSGPVTAL
jgi:hypothetical protein